MVPKDSEKGSVGDGLDIKKNKGTQITEIRLSEQQIQRWYNSIDFQRRKGNSNF